MLVVVRVVEAEEWRVSAESVVHAVHGEEALGVALVGVYRVVVKDDAHDGPLEALDDLLECFAHTLVAAHHARDGGVVVLGGEVVDLSTCSEHG